MLKKYVDAQRSLNVIQLLREIEHQKKQVGPFLYIKVLNCDASIMDDTASKESIEVKTITVIGFKSDKSKCTPK